MIGEPKMPASIVEGESVAKDEKRDTPEVAVVSQEGMAAQAAIDSAAEVDDATKATMLAEQIKGGVVADLTEEEKALNESRNKYAQVAQKIATHFNERPWRTKLGMVVSHLLQGGAISKLSFVIGNLLRGKVISKEDVILQDANNENEIFDKEGR